MKITKLLALLSASILLVGCDKPVQEEKPSESGTPSESSSSSSSSSSTDHTGMDFRTVTVETYGNTWKSNFSAGTGFVSSGSTNNSSNKNNLVAYLGGSDNIISDLAPTGSINSISYGEMNGECALSIGGQTAYGILGFTFAVDVESVTINMEGYYKTYTPYQGDPNNGLSLDTNSGLGLTSGNADDIVDLETTQEQGKKTANTEFTLDDQRALTLENMSNDHGRVMIKSITFNYYIAI